VNCAVEILGVYRIVEPSIAQLSCYVDEPVVVTGFQWMVHCWVTESHFGFDHSLELADRVVETRKT